MPSNAITASVPADKGMMFEPTASKIYRPTDLLRSAEKSATCEDRAARIGTCAPPTCGIAARAPDMGEGTQRP